MLKTINMRMNTLLAFCVACFFCLLSCNSETSNAKSDSDKKEIRIKVTEEFKLETSLSQATWSRFLDQKPTKQNVQLFGANVDVELGNVQMNTTGNATISSGLLTIIDDTLKHANVVFDMASFKLSKEKGNGLFDVVTYPNSELEMLSFSGSDSLLNIKGNLTIQNTSMPVKIEGNIDSDGAIRILTGSFSFNTLDFPLRDKVKASDVKQDVITINFILHFKQVSTIKDTID